MSQHQRRRNRTLSLLVLLCTLGGGFAVGASGADSAPPAATQPVDRSIAVAVLDFESNTPGSPDLGKQIGEVLGVSLAGEMGIRMVDRSSAGAVLREHELNLTGLVSQENATKIGKLVGAKILVTGKAFAVDKQIFITAKLIGTETSLFDGILVKGGREADTAELMMQLSQKVADRLKTAGPKLVAEAEPVTDPIPALKQKLQGRKLPKIAVAVKERHVAGERPAGIDPAVDTELKKVLTDAGFTVIEGSAVELDKAGVDLIVTGEAFSEFNARVGNLVACSARAEVKLLNRKDNQVLFADRTTARAVDLAENSAAKVALQKTGRDMAVRVLEHFAKTLPEEKKKK